MTLGTCFLSGCVKFRPTVASEVLVVFFPIDSKLAIQYMTISSFFLCNAVKFCSRVVEKRSERRSQTKTTASIVVFISHRKLLFGTGC